MASNRQLPAGDIDSLRSRLHDRALYPNQLDVDRRSYHEDAALSLRGSHRYTCPAWCGAELSSRNESLARPEQGSNGSVRTSARAETWRGGDDLSRRHPETEA